MTVMISVNGKCESMKMEFVLGQFKIPKVIDTKRVEWTSWDQNWEGTVGIAISKTIKIGNRNRNLGWDIAG